MNRPPRAAEIGPEGPISASSRPAGPYRWRGVLSRGRARDPLLDQTIGPMSALSAELVPGLCQVLREHEEASP